jgi:RNA polymerase sigma-70 factor, ECF subfamily
MSATHSEAGSAHWVDAPSDPESAKTPPTPRITGGEAPATGEMTGTPTGLREASSDDSRHAPDAFLQHLYTQYSRHLLSFVLRLNGGDWQWAEDVVQETMLRAWKHTASLQQSDSPNLMPWLTTVARRIVLNDQRSRRTRPTEVGDALLPLVTVQDSTERTIQHTILKDALAQLTPAQRHAIIEKYYWSRTGEEVARSMGVPVGTVKSRIHYALRILRTVLTDRGVSL